MEDHSKLIQINREKFRKVIELETHIKRIKQMHKKNYIAQVITNKINKIINQKNKEFTMSIQNVLRDQAKDKGSYVNV